MFKNLKKLSISTVVAVSLFGASDADAVTLLDGLTPDPGVFWNDLPNNSFDGASWNQFYSQLAPFIDQQAYILPATFTAGPATLGLFDALHMVEIAGASSTNTLDLCSAGGCETVFAGSDQPGDNGVVPVTIGEEYWFKLTNPADTFYSDASMNADLLHHFYAFKVVEAGTVVLSPVTLSGTPASITLNLAVGDILIGIEDLPGVFPASDRDFNDMLFKIVSTDMFMDVPEPMSLALLGAGLLGAVRLRRRHV